MVLLTSALVIAFVAISLFAAGYAAGKAQPSDYRFAILKQHAKMLRKARWAAFRHQDGLVNVYSEAAERLFERKEITDGT